MAALEEFFGRVYFGNTMERYVYFFLIIIGAAIVARAIYYLFKTRIRKFTQKTKTQLDELVIDHIEEPITLLFVVVGFFFAFKVLVLTDDVREFVGRVVFIVFLLNITWLFVRIVDFMIDGFLLPLVSKTASKLDDLILPVASTLIKSAIWVMVIIVLLSELGYDVLSLITGLGVGGAAIAIAAKDTLGHVFGGLNIFMNKPFQMGDTIVYKGIEGTVEEVGLRITIMRTVDDTQVFIPNSEISNSLLENLSARRARRTLLFVAVAPDTEAKKLERASESVKKALEATPGVRPGATCDLFDYVNYSMTFRIVYWIEDLPNYFTLRGRANTAIRRAIEESGVKLATPVVKT
jgi:MscS family membrane protein